MKIIGHRGAKGLAPENTIIGIEKAREHGVDEIEFDVRVTGDNIPILAHDPVVHDASGGEIEIKSHTYEELLKHNADIPTLASVLPHIDGKVHLDIEIKPNEPIEPIVTALHDYRGDFHIASFSYRTLRAIHRQLPDAQVIVNEQWSGMWATWQAKRLGTKRITMNQQWLWRGFIAPMARRGWQLSAYTVNDPVKAKKWATYGLYAIVTDFPDRFGK